MNIVSKRYRSMIWCLCLLPTAGCQAQDLKPVGVVKGGAQQPAAFAYINGSKYRLLQRHPYYWLLTDLQNSQQLHLTNQLVVSGVKSADELRKRLKIKPALSVKPITEGVLSISGTIADLMQIEPQLKQLAGVQTEWQLYYLPLKPRPER